MILKNARTGDKLGSIVVVAAVVLAALAMGPIGTVAAAQTNAANTSSTDAAVAQTNETSTVQPTEQCEPRRYGPSLKSFDLYSPDPVIKKGSPGSVSGTVEASPQNNCPVRIDLTLHAPTGFELEGGSDVWTGGGGTISTQKTLQPGEVASIRAQVYANQLGSFDVTSDINYWTVGHKQDTGSEIDGPRLSFTVEEPVTPTPSPDEGEQQPTQTPTTPSPDPGPGGILGLSNLQFLIVSIVAISFGLMALTYSVAPGKVEVIIDQFR
jgi:hypothetical protein